MRAKCGQGQEEEGRAPGLGSRLTNSGPAELKGATPHRPARSMTSARTRPGPRLGAGPVTSRSFPRTPGSRGPEGRREGGRGGPGDWPEGDGRTPIGPHWTMGRSPLPEISGIHSPGRDPASPAGFCVTAGLDLRLRAAPNFLRSFRGELSRCARAGFGRAGERRGSPEKAAFLKDKIANNPSNLGTGSLGSGGPFAYDPH